MGKKKRDWFSVLIRGGGSRLGFIKELVSNSIDSGSQSVEVTTKWTQTPNIFTVKVRDYGSGMGLSEVKEDLLSFPSTKKEGDHLYVGNRGVGFATLFFCQPQLIVVETAKMGIHLRILINPNGKYEVFKVETPFDGTEVTLYFSEGKYSFIEFKKEIFEFLVKWAEHAIIPVFCDGVDIRSNFTIDSPTQIDIIDGETTFILGFSNTPKGRGVFYNHGISILTKDSPFPWIDFKIDSPYISKRIRPHLNGENSGVEYLINKLRIKGVPALYKHLILKIKIGAVENNYNYKEDIKLLPKICQEIFSIADENLFPAPGDLMMSLRDLMKSDRIFLSKNDGILEKAAIKRGLLVLDGNRLKREDILGIIAWAKLHRDPVISDLADVYGVCELTPLNENSQERMFIEGFETILKELNVKNSGVFFGNTDSSFNHNWPWVPINIENKFVNFENMAKLPWDEKYGIMLIKNYPLISDILLLSKKNRFQAMVFITRAFLLSMGIEPNDKKIMKLAQLR
jgi:Histidine kinase-, DNA gyrase B-, and HSP90-like ATPase